MLTLLGITNVNNTNEIPELSTKRRKFDKNPPSGEVIFSQAITSLYYNILLDNCTSQVSKIVPILNILTYYSHECNSRVRASTWNFNSECMLPYIRDTSTSLHGIYPNINDYISNFPKSSCISPTKRTRDLFRAMTVISQPYRVNSSIKIKQEQ